MSKLPKITPRENGPLVLEYPPPITGAEGERVETKPVAALCRCGGSRNKPFCDGSHNDRGFKSAPDHSRLRNAPIDYSATVGGLTVTVSYTPVLCTHAAECQARAIAVFDPSRKPWIQPHKGGLEHILNVIAACPSGALRVAVGDVAAQHMTTGDVGIRVQRNGPYHVTNVTLEADFNGAGANRTKYSLCRCGLSKNKPFCDGAHHDAGWTDD